MCSMLPSARPPQWSLTSMCTDDPYADALNVTAVPGAVNLKAFWSRLAKAARMRSRSACSSISGSTAGTINAHPLVEAYSLAAPAASAMSRPARKPRGLCRWLCVHGLPRLMHE